MNNTLRLIRIELINLIKINKLKVINNKKENKNFIFLISMIFILLALLSISIVYSYILVDRLDSIGYINFSILIIMLVSVFITFYNTFINVKGVLFTSKYFDLIMSMPLKTSSIVFSKYVAMYISNIILIFFLLLPTGIIYAIKIQPAFVYYFYLILGSFLLPIIPMSLAVFVGSYIYRINKNIFVKYLLILLLTLALIAMNTSIIGLNSYKLTQLIEDFQNKIINIFPILTNYFNLLVLVNVKYLYIYLLENIIIGIIVLSFIIKKYNLIYAKINNYNIKKSHSLTKQHVNSKFFTLYKKDLKGYLNSSIYFLNTGMGLILMTIATLSLVFIPHYKIYTLLDMTKYKEQIISLIPMISAIFCSTACITYCSLSYEGKYIWLTKSLPLNLNQILDSKIFTNLTLTLTASIINGGILIYYFRNDFNTIEIISVILIPILYSISSAHLGIVINLIFPILDWTDEVNIVKQSIAMPITMFTSLLSVILPLILQLIFNINTIYFYIILIISIIIYIFILRKTMFSISKRVFSNI